MFVGFSIHRILLKFGQVIFSFLKDNCTKLRLLIIPLCPLGYDILTPDYFQVSVENTLSILITSKP